MNAQALDFPDIEEAAQVAALAPKLASIDLAKVDLTDVALAQFGNWRADVAAAEKKLTGLVLDLATQSKVDEAKSLRHRTVNQPVAEVRKVSKALKSKLASVSKAIGAEEEAAVAAWGKVGELLTPQIEAREAVLAAERAVRAQGEAFRVALHAALIERIRSYVTQATGLPSDRIAKGVTHVEAMTFGDECQDQLAKYQAAHAETLTSLRRLLSEAQASEAAEAQRLENERIAAELAAQRAALEAQAAELKRQTEAAHAARVSVTHAAVFSLPEPEPVTPPAAPASLVAANNAAKAAIAESAELQESASECFAAIKDAEAAGAITSTQARRLVETTAALVAEGVVAAIAAPAQAEPANLKLGAICERLGFTMTSAFVSEALGIQPAATDKRAVLYRESQFADICDALIDRISKAKACSRAAA